jgi:hypothetical protein
MARHNEAFASVLGNDRKGMWSMVLYLAGIALSCYAPIAGFAVYVVVAAMWFIPDRRIEKHLTH